MPERTKFQWQQVDWQDYYPRLLLYAAGKLRRLTWRGQMGGLIPGGLTAKDFAQNAIKLTVGGKRAWNPEVSLFQHLTGVVASEINPLVESEENKTQVRANEKIVLLADHQLTPEAMALRTIETEQFLAYLGTKDQSLRELAILILNGDYENVRDLAKKLNLSPTKLESLKKALRRASEDYLLLDNNQATKQA